VVATVGVFCTAACDVKAVDEVSWSWPLPDCGGDAERRLIVRDLGHQLVDDGAEIRLIAVVR